MVEQKLEPVHLVFSLIGANPDCVDSTDSDASDREKDAQSAHSLDWRTWIWSFLLVVIGDQADSETHRDQSVDCHSRDGFLVEEEVDDCDNGGQQDSSDLVEGNC